MNNLKRVLSLGLAGTMLTGMMMVGAGAADYKDFTDKDEIKNTEAVSTMALLGVIDGKDTGAFDPTATVNRAEMAKMITVALYGGVDPILGTKTTPTYTDIKGHWAEKYIEYCSSQKIIAGRGDGSFAPDATVTGTEAAKMMLSAMGYDATVYEYTGIDWSVNVNGDASDNDLYKGFPSSFAPDDGLSRDNAALLIYNGIQATILEKTPTKLATGEVSYEYKKKDGHTLLSDKFKVYSSYGQLVSVDKGNLKIDKDMNYESKNTSASNTIEDSFTKVAADYTSFLGETVKVLYKKTSEVVGVAPLDANVTYNVNLSAVEKKDAKVKFDGETYSIENSINTTTPIVTTSDVIRVLTLKADGTLTDTTSTAAALANNATSFNTVKFVDNDDDGKLEFAIITEIVPAKVTYVSSSEIIAGGTTYKTEDENIAEDIAKNDYVTIAYNFFAGNKDIVKAEKVSSTVSGYKTANGNFKYLVDGTWYIASTSQDSSAGDNITMVAVNGVIFWSEKTAGTTTLDGVIAVVKADRSTAINPQAMILRADGSKTTVKIDTDTKPADWPTSGVMYTYSETNNGYKFKSIVDGSKTGDYTYDATVDTGVQDSTGNTTGKISTLDGVTVDDNAIIYAVTQDGSNGKVITGKQLKNQMVNFLDTGNSNKDGIKATYTGKVNGLTRVTMASVKMSGNNLDNIGNSTDKYGIVVSGAYKMDSDYITFDLWDGTETQTVKLKDTSTLYTAKTIIAYSDIVDGIIKDVAPAAVTAGAIQGKNTAGTHVWINGQVTANEGVIGTDTVVLYADFGAAENADIAKAGGEIVLADEIGNTYVNNVYYIGALNGGDLDLLVVDVKNNIGKTYIVPTSGTSSTLFDITGSATSAKANESVRFTVTAKANDNARTDVKVTYGSQTAYVTVPAGTATTKGSVNVDFVQPAADNAALAVYDAVSVPTLTCTNTDTNSDGTWDAAVNGLTGVTISAASATKVYEGEKVTYTITTKGTLATTNAKITLTNAATVDATPTGAAQTSATVYTLTAGTFANGALTVEVTAGTNGTFVVESV